MLPCVPRYAFGRLVFSFIVVWALALYCDGNITGSLDPQHDPLCNSYILKVSLNTLLASSAEIMLEVEMVVNALFGYKHCRRLEEGASALPGLNCVAVTGLLTSLALGISCILQEALMPLPLFGAFQILGTHGITWTSSMLIGAIGQAPMLYLEHVPIPPNEKSREISNPKSQRGQRSVPNQSQISRSEFKFQIPDWVLLRKCPCRFQISNPRTQTQEPRPEAQVKNLGMETSRLQNSKF